MKFTIGNIVIQLLSLLAIAYGIYLATHYNDLRTSIEKQNDIRNGVILISIGSFILFFIWITYFISYKVSLV